MKSGMFTKFCRAPFLREFFTGQQEDLRRGGTTEDGRRYCRAATGDDNANVSLWRYDNNIHILHLGLKSC
jgi:hypothetical protein